MTVAPLARGTAVGAAEKTAENRHRADACRPGDGVLVVHFLARVVLHDALDPYNEHPFGCVWLESFLVHVRKDMIFYWSVRSGKIIALRKRGIIFRIVVSFLRRMR